MTRRYSGVEDLTSKHLVEAFDCGSDAQTTWLHRHALQSHLAGMSRVFVVRRVADEQVVGFYALTTGSVIHGEAPLRITQGTGKYDIPVILLARLGVNVAEKGHGLGTALLKDAFQRVEAVSGEVGVRALLIHAEDETARDWYLRRAAFEQSDSDSLHLLLLMKDLHRAMNKPERASSSPSPFGGIAATTTSTA